MADVFFGRIAEKIEFDAVGAQDRAVGADEVNGDRAVLE
jgi:hypothetical protein